ncbi:hypothetical protein F-VV10_0459 [Faustovirus]|nr:hypothetical protein F-VV10_0459 [Faustovirus]
MQLPLEIWGEISRHDYDAWRVLRLLNRRFKSEISSIDIKGRFDYIYHADSEYGIKTHINEMRKLFRRLTIVYPGEVVIYKYEDFCKRYIVINGKNVDYLSTIVRYNRFEKLMIEVVNIHNDKITDYVRIVNNHKGNIIDRIWYNNKGTQTWVIDNPWFVYNARLTPPK